METFVDLESSLLFLVKIGIIIFLVLYIFFAAIVIKQVRVMTETLQVGFEMPIKLLAFVHFTVSIFVLFFAIFFL